MKKELEAVQWDLMGRLEDETTKRKEAERERETMEKKWNECENKRNEDDEKAKKIWALLNLMLILNSGSSIVN